MVTTSTVKGWVRFEKWDKVVELLADPTLKKKQAMEIKELVASAGFVVRNGELKELVRVSEYSFQIPEKKANGDRKVTMVSGDGRIDWDDGEVEYVKPPVDVVEFSNEPEPLPCPQCGEPTYNLGVCDGCLLSAKIRGEPGTVEEPGEPDGEEDGDYLECLGCGGKFDDVEVNDETGLCEKCHGFYERRKAELDGMKWNDLRALAKEMGVKGRKRVELTEGILAKDVMDLETTGEEKPVAEEIRELEEETEELKRKVTGKVSAGKLRRNGPKPRRRGKSWKQVREGLE